MRALVACAATTVGPMDEEDQALRSKLAAERFEHVPTSTA